MRSTAWALLDLCAPCRQPLTKLPAAADGAPRHPVLAAVPLPFARRLLGLAPPLRPARADSAPRAPYATVVARRDDHAPHGDGVLVVRLEELHQHQLGAQHMQLRRLASVYNVVPDDDGDTMDGSFAMHNASDADMDDDIAADLERESRLADGLAMLGVPSHLAPDVLSLEDAEGCAPGAFDGWTQAVRRFARRVLRESADVRAHVALVVAGGRAGPLAPVLPAAPPLAPLLAGPLPLGRRPDLPAPAAALLAPSAPLALRATGGRAASGGRAATGGAAPGGMWTSELAGLGVMTGPETEAADSAAAAQALLVLIPDWVLAYGDSPSLSGFVPPEVRRANRHDLLMQKGVGSVKKARTYFAAWLSFAATHNLPRLGLPADSDACMWFLREYAEPGTAARHGAACGLRWLHTHMGLPFDAARQTVRAASRAPLSEPSFADMWPVFVLRHFFIIAITYTGPAAPFVRAYATAMYIAVAASLRLVDVLRSSPPAVVDGHLDGVARLTKGRRLEVMRPLPWTVPGLSPEPSIPHDSVAETLAANFRCVPAVVRLRRHRVELRRRADAAEPARHRRAARPRPAVAAPSPLRGGARLRVVPPLAPHLILQVTVLPRLAFIGATQQRSQEWAGSCPRSRAAPWAEPYIATARIPALVS